MKLRMTGLVEDVVVVLELVPEPELDPENESEDEEEPLPDDELSPPLNPELVLDEPLPEDDDEEPLPELFLLALALVVTAPWAELPPEEPLELLLP